jgi:phosphate starvation-inducible PhoH-like protein
MKLDLVIDNHDDIKNILGSNNINLRVLEDLYAVELELVGDTIFCSKTSQETTEELTNILKTLIKVSEAGIHIYTRDVIYVVNITKENMTDKYLEFLSRRKPICYTSHNKPIFAKTLKQDIYIREIKANDLIFSIGSAGTGKTYLAVCYAVSELRKGNYEKIILTRPAVEAGESLGFLPGDLKEKVDPYLRPLYDALNDMLGVEQTQALIDKGTIEIAPLAYMRGRTLENSFIILDEAQNATVDQLKMFLTRLGFNSKMVVTGDISQVDLPQSKKSGLKVSANLLIDIKGVAVVNFEKFDVVRHPLVAKIIERFETIDNRN